MNRREMFTATGAAVLAMAATSAMAEETHHDHDHAMMGHVAPTLPPNLKLIDIASLCLRTGLVCMNHCLDSFTKGDLSLAGCARTVDQMESVCATLEKLASINSPHLPAMAKIALAVCLECEKECRKHADHHAECKACAEACLACAEECRKIAA